MTLKNLPISYTGELHDIRLVNFSLDQEEAVKFLPEPLKLRLINGRAMVSMVDVKLKHMQPQHSPSALHFGYRHIAFRLLVDDSEYSNDYKGIHFIKSFTDRGLIALGGSLLTNYNLTHAQITEQNGKLLLTQGDKFLSYALSGTHVIEKKSWLKRTIGNLDRAYATDGDEISMVQIQRDKWPLSWVQCTHFETNFFETARLEGTFVVKEMIPYIWLPPKRIAA